MITRKCNKCKEHLTFNKFSFNKITNKFYRYCKKCRSLANTKYQKKPRPEKPKLIVDKNYRKISRLKSVYNLTIEEFEIQKLKQNGVCAICENNCVTKNDLCVDHCHETNKIRGLLCQRCNTALGKLMHNLKYLNKAIEYIKNGGVFYCEKYKK